MDSIRNPCENFLLISKISTFPMSKKVNYEHFYGFKNYIKWSDVFTFSFRYFSNESEIWWNSDKFNSISLI